MKGRMMRRLVTLCLVVLIIASVAAFAAIVLWDSDDAIIKWLALVVGVFSTELLGMLLKKLLEDKRAATAAKREEDQNG
jgi:hypothetical protein